LTIDIAERNGLDLRRWLRSAERLTDAAMRFGLSDLNTSYFRSIASLVSVTFADHLGPRDEVDLRAVCDLAMVASDPSVRRTLPSGDAFRNRARPGRLAAHGEP
jgi:hypothetical protein